MCSLCELNKKTYSSKTTYISKQIKFLFLSSRHEVHFTRTFLCDTKHTRNLKLTEDFALKEYLGQYTLNDFTAPMTGG